MTSQILALLSLIQCPLLASHCLPPYSPTELHVLYCVNFICSPFSFLGHSFNIVAPQKWLAEKTTYCSKVVTIVKRPLEQETALHSPPHNQNISPINNGMLLWVCHIAKRDASWPKVSPRRPRACTHAATRVGCTQLSPGNSQTDSWLFCIYARLLYNDNTGFPCAQ